MATQVSLQLNCGPMLPSDFSDMESSLDDSQLAIIHQNSLSTYDPLQSELWNQFLSLQGRISLPEKHSEDSRDPFLIPATFPHLDPHWQCPLCKVVYVRKGDLKKHFQQKHPERKDLLELFTRRKKREREGAYLCPDGYCDAGYLRLSSLKRHIFKLHRKQADELISVINLTV